MQTIGDRIWYRIHAFVLEKIAERLNEVGFTGGVLNASHVSGPASPLMSHSATGHTAATLGNTLYAAAAGVWALLAGNTTATRKFYRQTGTGAVSAAPDWDTLVDGDIPTTLAGKTLTTATLTAPTIADFTNAQHDHGDADDGGAVVGGGGAPTTADYLVGTADAGLSAEIVVGTTPGGELGGTWASPTVDATHSGSTHAGVVTTHEGLADPHTGYRLESADHSHGSSGLEGGPVSHLDLTDIDQATNPSHIPLDDMSDGDMVTVVAGEIDIVASGSEGQVLTADPDGIPEWQDAPAVILGAYKTTDQEVTTTTLAADSQLTTTLVAGTKYQFRFVLFFLNDGAAEGVKVSIDGDTQVVSVLAQVYVNNVSLGRIAALGGAGLGAAAAGNSYVTIDGAIDTGGVGGTFFLAFAQNATGASAGVHCEVGSSMMVTRLG